MFGVYGKLGFLWISELYVFSKNFVANNGRNYKSWVLEFVCRFEN